MRIFVAAIGLLAGCGPLAALAQHLYAAPGMPTYVPRRPPPPPPRPAPPPWLTACLPRFWHAASPELARQQTQPLWLALRERLRYPELALRQQAEGLLHVSILLDTAGLPRRAVVRQATFAPATSPEAQAALRAEGLRVAGLLRFAPASRPVADSLVLPFSFRIQ